MIAALVALLTATTTFAAVFPLMRAEAQRHGLVVRGALASTARLEKACRTIVIVKRPRPGTVTQGCSSARKRPCVRRRYW
jgi:hypothetical protein